MTGQAGGYVRERARGGHGPCRARRAHTVTDAGGVRLHRQTEKEKESISEHNPTPRALRSIVTGRSSGSPSSFAGLAFPCNAQWRSISVVRLTAAGAAPDWHEMQISRVTGFPFHPPADKREGTIHVVGCILHA
jgi:hypothetical protein